MSPFSLLRATPNFFNKVRAAHAVSDAIQGHRQPKQHDLKILGIEDVYK